jgi:hypothetical protein
MIKRLRLKALQTLLDQRVRRNQFLHVPCVPRASILTELLVGLSNVPARPLMALW